MKIKSAVSAALLALVMLLTMAAVATANGKKTSGKDTPTVTWTHNAQDDSMRLEGEKRFHSNCARCHASPPKFSPRMMGTIVRHMRVRANITDQEMRLILHYMSE